MMELSFFMQMCIGFFGVIGYLRGIYREFVSLAGIMLGLFILTEFAWLLDLVVGRSDTTIRFISNAFILILLAYFSYEQAPTMFAPSRYRNRRGEANLPTVEGWQIRIVGALIGAFNGYLVVGSLWYFMDQLAYPLDPLFRMPVLGSSSADFVNSLPLVWLQQGNLLVWLVAGLFLLIIVAR